MADERSKVVGLSDYLDDLELLYTHFHSMKTNLAIPFKTKDAEELEHVEKVMEGAE